MGFLCVGHVTSLSVRKQRAGHARNHVARSSQVRSLQNEFNYLHIWVSHEHFVCAFFT